MKNKKLYYFFLFILSIIFSFVAMRAGLAATLCSYQGPDLSPDLLRLTDLNVSGNSSLKVGDSVITTFKLQNYGQSDFNLGTRGIFAAAKDPDNLDTSFGFSYAKSVMKVGQILEITVSRVLDKAGVWKVWPSYHLSLATSEKLGPDEWHVCSLQVAAAVQDSDQDGITDDKDNCPFVYNPDQKNGDGDASGDVCDDADGDKVMDDKDNCIFTYNPQQEDIDNDKIGDACDTCDDRDSDKDGIKNCLDQCPNEPETFNNYQDNDGCPDTIPVEKPKGTPSLSPTSTPSPAAPSPTAPSRATPFPVVSPRAAPTPAPTPGISPELRGREEELREGREIPCSISGELLDFKYLSKTVRVKFCEAEVVSGGCSPTPPFTCFEGGVSCKEGGRVWYEDVRRVWAGEETYRNPGPLAYQAPVSCAGSYLIQPVYQPFGDECAWQGTWRPTKSNFVEMEGESQSDYDFRFTWLDGNPPGLNIQAAGSPAYFRGEGGLTLSARASDPNGIGKIKITGTYSVSYFLSDFIGPLRIASGGAVVEVSKECGSSPCDLSIPRYDGAKSISFDLRISACDRAGNKVETNYRRTLPDDPGDLSLVSSEPVQVIYGAALVKNKNTAFRAKINSTFPYPIETKFRLTLPPDKWSLTSKTGSRLIAFSPGWSFPDLWGPIKIPADARNYEVMLPVIADWQKELSGTGSGDATKMLRGEGVGDVYGVDVRLMPVPVADRVNFSVEIDPANEIRETNEGGNRFDSPNYELVKTRPWRFLIAPFTGGVEGVRGCAPLMSSVQSAAKRQLEYLLAAYPIAENKLEYGFAYANYDGACEDGSGRCPSTRTFNIGRAAFLGWMGRMAVEEGYDFAVAIGCGGGGGSTPGNDKAVGIGAGGREEVLAHEFNHALAPVTDIYSLDCYSSWVESYCEFPDGNRFYCCWQDYNREKREKEGRGIDPLEGCIIDCGQNDRSDCDAGCCHSRCETECDTRGGTVYYSPDIRPSAMGILPAASGFWVNKWVKKEGKQYFMDGPTGDNWITARSVREEGFHFCPSPHAQVDYDGYLNLLNHRKFRSATDPAALLVSGLINKNGTAKFNPFVYLPEATLDIEPGEKGDYNFVLFDGKNEILSQSGFNVYFYMSDPGGGPIDEDSFVKRIEWRDGTKRIELQDKTGKVLASRTVSENKPEAEILYPNGGEVFTRGEKIKIKWEASDKDEDALTYSLSLSGDGGKNWMPVEIDIKEKEYELKTDGLEEGEYLVKIKATDGVNTAEDVSDKPFKVAKKRYSSQLLVVSLIIVILFLAAVFGKKYLKPEKIKPGSQP